MQGLISLVSPISSLYVPITAILAWLVLKEKLINFMLLDYSCCNRCHACRNKLNALQFFL